MGSSEEVEGERFRRRTGLVNLPKPDYNLLFIEVTRTLV
jgi:hypothetical protein